MTGVQTCALPIYYEIDKIRNENISIPTFEIIKYTEGSWITSAGWCALVFVIGYIIINITKETLLYLLFADNYTFGWIKRWIPSLR